MLKAKRELAKNQCTLAAAETSMLDIVDSSNPSTSSQATQNRC